MIRYLLILLLTLSLSNPSHAVFGAIAQTANSAKDAVYQKFMMLKAVQQLKTLRDNYVASKRYYEKFKKLNEGKGILKNTANYIADIGDKTVKEAQAQFEYDWVTSDNYNSDVDKFANKVNSYVSGKIKYAGKVFEKSLDAKQESKDIIRQSNGLGKKDREKLLIRAQARQVELTAQINQNLAQLLELNARMYKSQQDLIKRRVKSSDIFNKSAERLKKAATRKFGE